MSPSPADTSSTGNNGKCPVDHKAGASSLWKVLGVQHKESPSSSPRDDELRQKNTPASLEEAAKHAQIPHPSQRLPLSTHRAESSIPRGAVGEIPHHQLGADTSKWVYPSEQQVFNAMKRKGWEGVEEESIPSFLQIHNSVNERSWRMLREWENHDVQLVRFEGRPNDLTPKAWIWSKLLFQDAPFDRHDWYVDNGVDKEKRYVLDFYMHEDKRSGLPKVEIDVRPALDTPSAFVERAQRLMMDFFPGITTELQRMKASSQSASGR
jgi:cytochrome c heme-lyase